MYQICVSNGLLNLATLVTSLVHRGRRNLLLPIQDPDDLGCVDFFGKGEWENLGEGAVFFGQIYFSNSPVSRVNQRRINHLLLYTDVLFPFPLGRISINVQVLWMFYFSVKEVSIVAYPYSILAVYV